MKLGSVSASISSAIVSGRGSLAGEAGSGVSERVSLAVSGAGAVSVVVSFMSGKVMFCVFGSRSNRIMSRYSDATACSVM